MVFQKFIKNINQKAMIFLGMKSSYMSDDTGPDINMQFTPYSFGGFRPVCKTGSIYGVWKHRKRMSLKHPFAGFLTTGKKVSGSGGNLVFVIAFQWIFPVFVLTADMTRCV